MKTITVGLLLFAVSGIASAKPKDREIKLAKGTVVLPGEWFACTVDDDCDVAMGPRECWETMVPIHKKFKKAAEDKMSPKCGGEPPGGVIGGAHPICSHNECR
jgi:hypothetical protein